MAQTVCRTLGALHGQRVIHKDINPNNIVLDPEHPTDARLIDFGLASRMSRESVQLQQAGHWVGTLAYISPEQTGRMNRPVDYRTDLYSLGATFYHALTGVPPFDTRDPMELVHAHMARAVVPPSKLRPEVPQALDEIVLKLMAKAPEDRYQSADGVAADLSLVARLMQEGALGGVFRAGERDALGKFLIPEHLYGRQAQVDGLMEVFGRIERARCALVLVEGIAGAGKTALIQEVLKPITRARGNYVRGKCDPLRRNVPYASLLQGLEPLVASLLTLDEGALAQWKGKLAEALGPNGALITRLLPALEHVIGPQPEPGELTPGEAQNRFNRVFRSFLMAFAGADHPLVVALDDLQWADSATLKLLEVLLAGGDTSHLLIIGSAREEEVDAAHPLTHMLESLRKAAVDVTRLHIGPLKREDVLALLRDTLRRDALTDGTEKSAQDDADLVALADLLLDRTQGNAFFLNQLLLAFHQDGALRFDLQTRLWTWDLGQLKRAGYRSGVEGLIAGKILRLPPQTQRALQGAACIGSAFDLATLAKALEMPLGELVSSLNPAITEGLIEARGEAYVLFHQGVDGTEITEGFQASCAFLHDYIRQAAASTLAADARAALHLRLGRLRLAATTDQPEALEAALFDILGHFHQATAALITDPTERLSLAKLALRAGKKARDAVAFDAAAKHLAFGAAMLGDGAQTTDPAPDPALAFELLTELGRCHYLTGAFTEAEAIFERLLASTTDPLARAHVVTIKLTLYLNVGRLADVVEQGLQALAIFGHEIPGEPGGDLIGAELTAVLGLMANRDIDSLKDLPPMSDLGQFSAVALMFFACIASYLSGRTALWQVLVLRMVRTCIEKGNTPFGAYAYPAMAMIVGPGLGDYKAAHAWGRVGVDVGERSGSLSFRCVANFLMGCFIDYWGRPLRDSVTVMEQAFQDGLDSGNLIYCAYCLSGIGIAAAGSGQPLSELAQRANQGWVFSRKIQYDDIAQYYPIYQQYIRALSGKTRAPTSLSDDAFDEDAFLAQLVPRSFHVPRHVMHILKMQLCYLFGDLEGAQRQAEASEGLLAVSFALHHATDHHLYRALVEAAAAGGPDATPAQVEAAIARVEAAHKQFCTWAANAPANFGHKVKLLGGGESPALLATKSALSTPTSKPPPKPAPKGFCRLRPSPASASACFTSSTSAPARPSSTSTTPPRPTPAGVQPPRPASLLSATACAPIKSLSP